MARNFSLNLFQNAMIELGIVRVLSMKLFFGYLMARSHQKYFTSNGHRMAIRQNGFLYHTIQHSHTSDTERMEI